MKNILKLFLLITFYSNAQDVRNVNWGNTKEEVKKSEKYLSPALDEKDLLKYEDIELGLLNADLEYSFENNRLINIKYLLRIDGRPISIMHDENVNLSTAISFLNLTSGLISYLESNDLNKGFWNNYRHSIKVAPYKQSNYEISKVLTKLSEENDYDNLWNNKEKIVEIENIISENELAYPCWSSENKRTEVDITFSIIDNLPEKSKISQRKQNNQVKELSLKVNKEMVVPYSEDMPLIVIKIGANSDVKEELNKGF